MKTKLLKVTLLFTMLFASAAQTTISAQPLLIVNTTAIYNAVSGALISNQTATAHYLHCNMGWGGQDNKFYLSGYFLATPYTETHQVAEYQHRYLHDLNFQYDQKMAIFIRE